MPRLFGDTAATLIVDDDPGLADVLRRLLSREGYDCTVVSSAAQARAALADRDFAVALVDVMMPEETGLELVADMLAEHPNLAVVMVTAVDDVNIAKLAIDSGVYGYVVKPFRPSQVLITVANASQRRCVEIERDVYERRLEVHVEEQAVDLDAALIQLKDAKRYAEEPHSIVSTPESRLDADVVHDVNNLLGAIVNYAFFINEEAMKSAQSGQNIDVEGVGRDADRIQRAAQHAAELIRKLRKN